MGPLRDGDAVARSRDLVTVAPSNAPDDGPLTSEQLERIRALAAAEVRPTVRVVSTRSTPVAMIESVREARGK